MPLDNAEKIIGLYEERSGVTPDFPIVDFAGGGRQIAELFGFAAGGQAHMMHPDYEFERIPSATSTPYKKEYMIPGIQAALDDDCKTVDIISSMVDNKAGIKNTEIIVRSLTEKQLVLEYGGRGILDISIFNVVGRKVYSTKKDLAINTVVNFDNQKLSSGSYIVRIKDCKKIMISTHQIH